MGRTLHDQGKKITCTKKGQALSHQNSSAIIQPNHLALETIKEEEEDDDDDQNSNS